MASSRYSYEKCILNLDDKRKQLERDLDAEKSKVWQMSCIILTIAQSLDVPVTPGRVYSVSALKKILSKVLSRIQQLKEVSDYFSHVDIQLKDEDNVIGTLSYDPVNRVYVPRSSDEDWKIVLYGHLSEENQHE